jgi:hypothetical protein
MKHTKPSLPRKGPKRCPRGHMHISWSVEKDEVYCWDCNKKYSISECSGSHVASADSVTEKTDEEAP